VGRFGGTKWLLLSCAASAFHGEMTRKGHGMGTIHDLWITSREQQAPATTICFKSMTTVTEIGISRRPEIRGGRPCITGTGVSLSGATWSDSVRRIEIYVDEDAADLRSRCVTVITALEAPPAR
jgi:hypothetical protein